MTDLHCHILPGIDDGARDVDTALEMLAMEREQGVNRVVFTPHFDCDKMSVEEFVLARRKAYNELSMAFPEDWKGTIKFKLGAEVKFSPLLRDVDLSRLCIGKTKYMLIELPFTSDVKPAFLDEVLFDISSRGITPIIAHVERYPYILSDPTQIYNWVMAGYLVQVNAATVISGDRMIKKLISWGLVQVVSTDAHNLDRRVPNLGKVAVDDLLANGDLIYKGLEVEVEPYCPRRSFGSWK